MDTPAYQLLQPRSEGASREATGVTELPNRPDDPLYVLVEVLRRSGASEETITSFIVHWRTVFHRATKRPCPLCYAKGGWGELSPMADGDDVFYRCEVCFTQFK